MGKSKSVEFTKTMKKTHRIFMPDMLHYHNELLQAAFEACGYQMEIIPEKENSSEYALPYISGDYCLPAMQILGHMLALVQNRECDVEHIAFMEPQTGGACRAGNYYDSIIKSMEKAGYADIPVISLNVSGQEKHEGFTITPRLVLCAAAAVCYGDMLMTLSQQTMPYEVNKGDSENCRKKWIDIISDDIKHGKNINGKKRREQYKKIVEDFSDIPVRESALTKVGIAGEIYIKFSPAGNEHMEKFLQENGYDYRMGGFINYVIYIADGELEKQRLHGAGKSVQKIYTTVIRYMEKLQKDINTAITCGGRFKADAGFSQLKNMAEPIIRKDCNIGDGWLIAGEVVDLIEQGYNNILILHPFGCLVSHVCIRGIMKNLHKQYPKANIQAIEFDYDSSKTLRESRIMLGLSGIHKK